jgi:hypothetical protein
VALLLGIAALLGASGLQTIWAPPETMTATVGQEPAEAPLTVITPGIDAVDDDPVEFTVTGEGSFNVMLGRDRDVQAWVGDAAHNTFTGITTDVPDGEAPRIDVEHSDGEAEVPNPKGSDLWLDVQQAQDRLEQRWSVPSDGDWSLLIARDGTEPAPTELTVTWTNRVGNSPWIVPLYVIGGLLALVGVALLAWAVVRRTRGPRGGASTPAAQVGGSASPRSTPGASGTGSTTAPSARVSSAPISAVPTAGAPSRRGGRGLGAGIAVLAIGLAGIAPAGAAPTTTAAASAPASEETTGEEAYPVLTDVQLERILGKVAYTVRVGDAAKSSAKLRPRVASQALEIRTLNYRNRKIEDSVRAAEPVAATPVLSAAAVSDPSFPRTAMAVTEGTGNSTPQILVLRQESARGQYRLVDSAPMTPGAELPAGSLDQTGIEVMAVDDREGLVMSPGQAVAGTARYLTDPSDDFWKNIHANPHMTAVHQYQDDLVAAAEDARIRFHRLAVPDSATTLRLQDGSALVFGHLDARTVALPAEAGGTVIVEGLAAELVGTASGETGSGLDMTYREVLALHVPASGASGDDAKVSLVGMTDELDEVEFRD